MRTVLVARLKELLIYDPISGVWTRRITIGRHDRHKAGTMVGHKDKTGYISIRIDGVLYLAHRLAFLYMTGKWPASQVDHKNLIRDDNRWDNLRLASHGQNVQNSSLRKNNGSGFKGAHIMRRKYELKKSYRARITVNRKEIHLGYFETAEKAHCAYLRAARTYFKEFARAK